ncbi:MAG: thioredoxin domain-containing protein [Gammaproteobacteria bacterium]|nr:thioredoxin domain-containing protein [Gammaproteobacteria bacterium]MDH5802054.1 thioredoxin domain-containing protein [Gammaproteobacteria bacterium]
MQDCLQTSNQMAGQTSPYLLQHQHNPVHWLPWGEQALALARRLDKPILLSIGYSACHWCHVMAHESFEDEATAELMNRLYINIKVDREERPDLDRIYQTAHQILLQRGGGWPLTVILTPEQIPFFAGTYFPKDPPRRDSAHQMPAFAQVLQQVEQFYRQYPEELQQQNQQVLQLLQQTVASTVQPLEDLNASPLDMAYKQLAQSFDEVHGGFGKAPKFPHPSNLERLLRQGAAEEGTSQAMEMVRTSLLKMARGGLFDQLGGGFFRYCVDDAWTIPHFEKMLYDNSSLLGLYAWMYAVSGDSEFAQVAHKTARWVLEQMQNEAGGYYSSLDADSEGGEGAFYVWKLEQLTTILNESEYGLVRRLFGLDQAPNFASAWHLVQRQTLAQVAAELSLTQSQAEQVLATALNKMAQDRGQRPHPGLDEKVLTAWNGLMIKGMAVAAGALDCEEYLRSAQQAVDFLKENCWNQGRLLACYSQGQARLRAYLDDTAFLMDGLLELLCLQWRDQDMRWLIQLADTLLEHFEDTAGGFFFTANDHETLIQRPKVYMDEAIPAGNGVAAKVLLQLAALTGEQKYQTAGQRVLQNAWESIQRLPLAHCAILTALQEYLYPPALVVICGKAEPMQSWRQQLGHNAQRWVVCVPESAQFLPGTLALKQPGEQVKAYVCAAGSCSLPITDLQALLERLDTREPLAP